MPGGRTPKYDWDDKRDVCYQLFVVEKKSPNEIVTHFANHFGVPESELPSARLFRRQFTEKWQFPPRKPKLTPEDEAAIVSRIRSLWEQNLPVAQIRSTLDEEGWELGDNEFQRLRKGNGFTRRGATGAYDVSSPAGGAGPSKAKKRKRDDVVEEPGDTEWGAGPGPSTYHSHGLAPQEAERRAQHLAKVQQDSDAALAKNKRRRRIRGYGHLPPDEPSLGPRYNSETTLDECKAFLHLDNETYMSLRSAYEQIAREMGIERKKTVRENGLWEASKERLVRESHHLSAVLHPLQPDLERKLTAIDVICADVTKRMRGEGKKMTVGEANNVLGLSPSGSKEVRRSFYNILVEDQYTTRLACGDAHWAELRQEWFDAFPLLQQVMYEMDPTRVKALEVLCRDACKRYNDDSLKKDPTRRVYQQKLYGPGPGSAKAKPVVKPETAAQKKKREAAVAKKEKDEAKVVKKEGKKVTKIHAKTPYAAGSQTQPINVDPSLTSTTNGLISNPYTAGPPPEPIPAYFRLAPASQIIGNHPRLWLGKLTARTVAALHQAAASKAGAAKVTKVHGLIKNEEGTEDSYQIDREDELDAYLGAAGEKATFLVVLEGGYA
ncbi:hypothetical protein LTR17_006450 [Elasticomyces elasticus]|nr:hypothetical protein LTR17_006450 [Elasticomyces elasticus]